MENNRRAIYFIPIDCTTQRLAVAQANPFSNSARVSCDLLLLRSGGVQTAKDGCDGVLS